MLTGIIKCKSVVVNKHERKRDHRCPENSIGLIAGSRALRRRNAVLYCTHSNCQSIHHREKSCHSGIGSLSWSLPVGPQFEKVVSLFLGSILQLRPSIGDLEMVLVSHTSNSKNDGRTRGKYRSIALVNLCLYCFGVTIVGSPLPAPPRKADSFTQLSSFLSQVYVLT